MSSVFVSPEDWNRRTPDANVKRLVEVARKTVKQFEAIKEHQRKLLVEGQTLESASANWDEAALGQSIDFEALIEAVKDFPEEQ